MLCLKSLFKVKFRSVVLYLDAFCTVIASVSPQKGRGVEYEYEKTKFVRQVAKVDLV
jgi:hypothetical protein